MSISKFDPGIMESVACYLCGASSYSHFTDAWEDLTGKPGTFYFVRCNNCGLVYQNPRVDLPHIRDYYDDEYIAHRKKTEWGPLTPLYNYAMNSYDRRKMRLASRYIAPDGVTDLLDVGCGSATFLQYWRTRSSGNMVGVDFKDLSGLPGFEGINFYCGLFYDQPLSPDSFDLVTMWHFLEHDYDPLRTLATALNVLRPGGRLVIEVPRLDSVTFKLFRERWPGLQAPQHTVLYERNSLLAIVKKAGFEIVDWLPYGAFPAYFYIFAGIAFKILKGRGLNLSSAIYPYFLGQALLFPALLFEKKLNLAMQTVICRAP